MRKDWIGFARRHFASVRIRISLVTWYQAKPSQAISSVSHIKFIQSRSRSMRVESSELNEMQDGF
jgi:hypothetical protein